MKCQTQVCEDARDSIGPDGECHDYDETLESRHKQLQKEANKCATSVQQMGKQIQDLMAKLQKETSEKE